MNAEEMKARRNEQKRQSKLRNIEKVRAYNAEYREKNREKLAAYQRERWACATDAQKARHAEIARNSRARKKGAGL